MAFLATYQAEIIGIIFMLILGPAVGNYACSVVYRLPLGKTPFEQNPYCGHCGASLQPRDLFPILSWLSTKGKCRYCTGAIPSIYTLIELACGAAFIAYFLKFGISEQFLLYAAFATFVVILAAIEYQQGWLSVSIYGYALTMVALARTVAEGTIYGWVSAFVIALVAGLAIERLHRWIINESFLPFRANWLWWMALIAVSVPLPLKQEALLLLLLPLAILLKRGAVLPTAATALLLVLFV
jgi:prepilin signal peptidase PulO-like enzyme (type II secretory pathway)